MTDKDLVGNLSLESLLTFCEYNNIATGLKKDKLMEAQMYPLQDYILIKKIT